MRCPSFCNAKWKHIIHPLLDPNLLLVALGPRPKMLNLKSPKIQNRSEILDPNPES